MIKSETTRDRIFKDFHFYQSKQDVHKITQYQFQKIRGNQEINTFRKKKQPIFKNYTYSSNMNPLSRGYGRYDKPYRQTYERKKMNTTYSFIKTNPVLLIYQPNPKTPKIRNHDNKYFGSTVINEHRFELPSRRAASPVHKKYWCQSGFSMSLQPRPKLREFMNSKNMKSTIEYTAANHLTQRVTDKIGHQNHKY